MEDRTPDDRLSPSVTGSGLERRMADLEAQLHAYKRSLAEIYGLYNQKVEELSLIRRVGDSIRSPFEIESLCRAIVEAVAREIATDRLVLLIMDDARRHLRLRTVFDADTDEIRYLPEDEAEALPPYIFKESADTEGKPVYLSNADPGDGPFPGKETGPVSLLLLPLVARQRMVGLLALTRPAAHPFNNNDERVLTIIADHAAIALANVRLFNELADANLRLVESERQARRTSTYLESLLENASDVIITLDESGRITYVNRKVEIWGYGKETLPGRTLDDILDSGPDGAEMPIILAGNVQSLETGIRTAGDSRREVLVSASVLDQGESGPVHLVLIRDITERKQLLKQLFHSEKLASIGVLAAGVAHEIGNPLSAISGYAQIMQGDTTPEECGEYLDAIEEQARRIQRIIEDLLNYSRPSGGVRSEIDLVRELPQVMQMLTNQMIFRHLKIEYDIADDVPRVIMDRDQLTQVVVNIAINAAQAMKSSGTLALSLKRQDGMAAIVLSDNGPGIPPEVLPRLFDPFFTTKPAGQGTGLGLAICHRIIESHKGRIDVESAPGKGTSFTIYLPPAAGETGD